MAIVLARETGFVMTEQLPCLKLNGYSITPENDVAMCLYMSIEPTGRVRIIGLASALSRRL